MPFEPQAAPYLTGDITSLTVNDPNGLSPAITVIRIHDQWTVNVQWFLQGDLGGSLNPSAVWHVSIRLESIGDGYEGEVAHKDVQLVPSGLHNYNENIPVPPLDSFNKGNPGVYKLVAIVTTTVGAVSQTLSGYLEGPMLQFYDFP